MLEFATREHQALCSKLACWDNLPDDDPLRQNTEEQQWWEVVCVYTYLTPDCGARSEAFADSRRM